MPDSMVLLIFFASLFSVPITYAVEFVSNSSMWRRTLNFKTTVPSAKSFTEFKNRVGEKRINHCLTILINQALDMVDADNIPDDFITEFAKKYMPWRIDMPEQLRAHVSENGGIQKFINFFYGLGVLTELIGCLEKDKKENGIPVSDIINAVVCKLPLQIKNNSNLSVEMKNNGHLKVICNRNDKSLHTTTINRNFNLFDPDKIIELNKQLLEKFNKLRWHKIRKVAIDAVIIEVYGDYEGAVKVHDHTKNKTVKAYVLYAAYDIESGDPVLVKMGNIEGTDPDKSDTPKIKKRGGRSRKSTLDDVLSQEIKEVKSNAGNKNTDFIKTQPCQLPAWDNILKKNDTKLREFLGEELKMTWIKDAEIKKSNDDKTITLTNERNSLTLKFNKEENKELDNEGSFLFNLDISYKKYLENAVLDDKLKKAFKHHEISLSYITNISKISEGKWEITPGRVQYIVKEANGQLSVYKTQREWYVVPAAEILSGMIDEIKNQISKNIKIVLIDRGFYKGLILNELDRKGVYFVIPAKRYESIVEAMNKIPIEKFREDEVPEDKKDKVVSRHIIKTRQRIKDYSGTLTFIVISEMMHKEGKAKKGGFAYEGCVEKRYGYLTNISNLTAQDIEDQYRMRWCIENFFKELKHDWHLKNFPGTTLKAVKNHIFLTLTVYLTMNMFKRMIGMEKAELKTIRGEVFKESVIVVYNGGKTYILPEKCLPDIIQRDLLEVHLKIYDRDNASLFEPPINEAIS